MSPIDLHANHCWLCWLSVGAHGVRPNMTTPAPVLTEQKRGALLFVMGFTNILLLAFAQAPRMQGQKGEKDEHDRIKKKLS